MLRNRGIRTKLLGVLALPVIVLLIVAAVVSVLQFRAASKASQVEQLARGAGTLGQLVSDLQSERSVSQAWLEKRPVKDELATARKATDTSLLATRAFIGSVDLASLSLQATTAVGQAAKGHAAIAELRAQVDRGTADHDGVNAQYSTIVGYDITLPQRIGDGLADREIGGQLAAYSFAQNLGELATQEREVGLDILAAGPDVSPTLTGQLARLVASQIDVSTDFRRHATARQISALDVALNQPVELRAEFQRQEAALAGSGGLKVDFSASDWRTGANPRIDALGQLGAPVASTTATIAGDQAAAARNRALLVLLGGLALVLFVGGLGVVLARAMTSPLRRLTVAAGQLSAELPRMVERMATPGEGPGVQLPDIPITSTDEVGQLARAFKEVNETTVRVAEEQAALRASIAEMFVNVARRNHVLLSRQLSFIDQLERTEENPDTLDNLFRLDHLATRMRRNAESLIVLAGIDAGRRLRRPMPLSDVIRTAVSEIERYDRVDLSLQADPPLVGHVALTTAHMIAELLENATQFSNPDTRVITSTAFGAAGVRVTVTDLGLGMTWDEITDANQRIANPPVTDVVGSQRLGFFVVGRLARRLDATVALRPGRTQGTIVTIDLPPSLFVPGSVVEVPGIVEEPAANGSTVSGSSASGPDADEEGASPELVAASNEPRTASPQTGLLPRRGEEAAPRPAPASARREPRVPVSLPPFPDAAPVAREGASTDAPSLPRRARGTETPLVPMEPVADPPPVEAPSDEGSSGPRSGIFSGFRSRRAVDELAETPQVPVDLDAERPLGVLDDEPAAEFVPMLEESAPLASRGGLPSRGAPIEVVDDVTEVGTEAWDAVASPGPLDAAWTPALVDEPSADAPKVAELVDGGLVDGELADAELVVAELVDGELVVAELVDAELRIDEPRGEEPYTDEPVTQAMAVVVHDGSQARSALSDLARDPEPRPEPQPVAVAVAVADVEAESQSQTESRVTSVQDEAPAATFPVIGLPAMDILPSKGSGRGLRRRKPAKGKAADERPAEVWTPPTVSATGPPAAKLPAARVPARTQEPVVHSQQPVAAASSMFTPAAPAVAPVSEIAPQPAAGEPAAGEPAAGGPAVGEPATGEPEAVGGPGPAAAPSSLFTPAPTGQASEPAPAIPALAAAQSLRERSAMASEALSELSALSSYSPRSVQQATPASLIRRTPQATPAGQAGQAAQLQPEEGLRARRGQRNAADVRTMLSGFRAGVERGRTSPDGNAPVGGPTDDDSPHDPQ